MHAFESEHFSALCPLRVFSSLSPARGECAIVAVCLAPPVGALQVSPQSHPRAGDMCSIHSFILQIFAGIYCVTTDDNSSGQDVCLCPPRTLTFE